jgi:hypothetical protein
MRLSLKLAEHIISRGATLGDAEALPDPQGEKGAFSLPAVTGSLNRNLIVAFEAILSAEELSFLSDFLAQPVEQVYGLPGERGSFGGTYRQAFPKVPYWTLINGARCKDDGVRLPPVSGATMRACPDCDDGWIPAGSAMVCSFCGGAWEPVPQSPDWRRARIYLDQAVRVDQ